MSGALNGACLCGSVTFTAIPTRKNSGACHCSQCRRWTAGPFIAIECGESFALKSGEEDLKFYTSSEWGERGFCRGCGSTLLWRLRQPPHHSVVSAAALEGGEDLPLRSEIFIDDKPASYTFADETKTMTGAEVFALFAGKGE